ncbi:MAG: hypothetical protein ACRENJ_00810 [Candidatus Eiseniibacteriota bacterium]
MRLLDSLRSLHRHRVAATTAAVALGLLPAASSVLAQCPLLQNCWPPPGCAYPQAEAVFYSGTSGPTGIDNLFLASPTTCAIPPTQAGSAITSVFDIFVEVDLSTDGGATWTFYSLGLRPCAVAIQPPVPQGTDLLFDTEMLQLDLSGGGLPVMIRESPVLPSLGKTLQNGNYQIDSFFDVFTELSLDGGQTWHASGQPLHLTTIDQTPLPTRTSTWGTVKIRYR